MPGQLRRAALALAALLALAACRGRSTRRDAAVAPEPAISAGVVVVLDGHAVARVTPAELTSRRPLADFLPAEAREPATWARLNATSDDARTMSLADVAERYEDHDVVLYLAPGGRPSIGVFPPIRADQPAHVRRALEAPAASLVGASRIAIDRAPPPTARPGPPKPLVVTFDGRTVELDPARLDALALVTEKGKGHTHDAWELRDVLAAAGVGPRATITAVGREGSATFTRAELDTPGVLGRFRRNRRGELRLGIDRTAVDGGASVVVHDVSRLDVRSP
jgi:hypothetical protein